MNAIKRNCSEYGCHVVSSDSIRYQDTLPRMVDALSVVNPKGHSQWEHCTPFGIIPSHAQEDPNAAWWSDDDNGAPAVSEQLHEALNEAAPEGFHFGTHPGDGACLGFWKDDDHG